MAARRGTKAPPVEWRRSVAIHIETWIVTHGLAKKTSRQIAPMLGISQPTLVQLRNQNSSLGIDVLVKLRESMRVSIDDLLGLRPLRDEAAETPTVPPAPTGTTVSLAPDQLQEIIRGVFLRLEEARRARDDETSSEGPR